MPNKKPIVKYSDGQYQFKVPFMMYADFESILEQVTNLRHTPSRWCVYSHFAYGNLTNPLTQYRDPDCINKFCKHIISEAKQLYSSLPRETNGKSQIKEYKRAAKCHICFKPFSEKKRKVRDHCDYSGLYR